MSISQLSEHNQILFNKLKSLNLPKGEYVVFGSGAMMIRGLKDAHDIDVFVSKKVFEEYKNKEGWKLKPCKDDFYLSKEGIELWDKWGPGEWDFDVLVNSAEYIHGIPFVTLETTKKWKLICGREKDLSHVKIIDDYLSHHRL